MDKSNRFSNLQDIANDMRIDVAKMFWLSTNGHYGGCFSIPEIISCLYFDLMNVKPEDPAWEDRDRFVLSKGHCGATVYSALARRGFFPMSWLEEYETLGSPLNVHPNMLKVPGCEISTGALGHGLSLSVGMALGGKLKGKEYYTYCVLGDGECHEGEVWEAAMTASKYKLDRLITIVDRNKLCVTGNTEDVMPLEPFAQRWEAFGWEVVEINGHDCRQICDAVERLRGQFNGKPKLIIANTIKGKGVSFMEGVRKWHGGHVDYETHCKIMEELTGLKGSANDA